MKYFKKIWNLFYQPYAKYVYKRKLEKRLAELRKRDPFIYK
jgi:hypothetical protein